MAMASSSTKGRNRRLLYRVKSSTASDGSVVYSCIFSCIDDVEHHRHRRNPFDPKYIQAALSSFNELGRDDCGSIATREEVEAASTSVHVRMELIKSMKDSLVKLTGEAVKHCKGAAKKVPKYKLAVEGDKAHVVEKVSRQQEGQPEDFFQDDSFNMYQKKFGQAFKALQAKREIPGLPAQNHDSSATMGSIDLGLAQVMKELDVCLSKNTNFVSEDELCFNINKETMDTLHTVLQRTQSDVEQAIFFNEEDRADLSPYKGFISPITKDLILDFEDSQTSHQAPVETKAETSLQHNKTETKNCQKEYKESEHGVCTDGFSTASIALEQCACPELYQLASREVINKPLVASKSINALDRISSMGGTAAISEPDDISSPTMFYQDSMEISSEDEAMEGISHEELLDDIEDGEQIETGTSVYFCLQDQDMEKFLLLRRQMKRSKNPWLVQNPEKLLLPDIDNCNRELKTDDIQSFVKTSVTVGRIFQEALSRPGMDLVTHYNMLQEDPSKITGAFRFDSSTLNSDSNDLPATGYSDTIMQEPGPHNEKLDKAMYHNKLDEMTIGHIDVQEAPRREHNLPGLQETSKMLPPQRNSLSSEWQENSLCTEEVCWDNFSWATRLAPTGQRIEGMQSAECNEKHDSHVKQGTEEITGNRSSATNEVRFLGGMEAWCRDTTTTNICHMPPAEQNDTHRSAKVTKYLQPKCRSDSVQSSGVVNYGNPSMERENQDDAVSEMEGQETAISAVMEGSTVSCLSSEVAVYQQTFPFGAEVLMKDVQAQVCQMQKKRFHLEELITGAVMAECQLHQKTFSHYDLEPLSQLLSAHIASIYQEQKIQVIVFKDLVAACNCAQDITLQRYFVALLSSAHQQNMGNLKDIRLEGLQILLEAGVSGMLSEININLLPTSHSMALA